MLLYKEKKGNVVPNEKQKTKKSTFGFSLGKKGYREHVTQELLTSIEENGVNPWVKDWQAFSIKPRNPISGTVYKGGNGMYLAMMSFLQNKPDTRFATRNQIEVQGGNIKDFKDGFIIEYYQFGRDLRKNEVEALFSPEDVKQISSGLSVRGKLKVKAILNDSDKESEVTITKLINRKTKKPYLHYQLDSSVPIRKSARVFNLQNTEGLEKKYPVDEGMIKHDWSNLNDVEIDRIIDSLLGAIDITLENDTTFNPCYMPDSKVIRMPEKSQFKTREEYYGTVFHEYGHALVKQKDFTEGYLTDRGVNYATDLQERASEEVLVEMFSVFLASETGVAPTFENSASYIQGWTNRITNDENVFHRASRISGKMADFAIEILNSEFESIKTEDSESSTTVLSR